MWEGFFVIFPKLIGDIPRVAGWTRKNNLNFMTWEYLGTSGWRGDVTTSPFARWRPLSQTPQGRNPPSSARQPWFWSLTPDESVPSPSVPQKPPTSLTVQGECLAMRTSRFRWPFSGSDASTDCWLLNCSTFKKSVFESSFPEFGVPTNDWLPGSPPSTNFIPSPEVSVLVENSSDEGNESRLSSHFTKPAKTDTREKPKNKRMMNEHAFWMGLWDRQGCESRFS